MRSVQGISLRPSLLSQRVAPQRAQPCRARRVVSVRADGTLAEALAAAPPQALIAGGITVLGALGAAVWAATQQLGAGAAEEAAPAAEPKLARENAVLLLGAGGRMGRALTASVRLAQEHLAAFFGKLAYLRLPCPAPQNASCGQWIGSCMQLLSARCLTCSCLRPLQLLKEGRTVVAAARSAERARKAFEKLGVTEGKQASVLTKLGLLCDSGCQPSARQKLYSWTHRPLLCH